MNLAFLINLAPLIELSLLASVVLLHFSRASFGIGAGGVFGFFFILVCSAILMIPFNQFGAPWSLPFVAYIRGVTGDLSMISAMLILFTWTSWPGCRLSNTTPLIIALLSILFYPFALGFTMFDPYAWGYGSIMFVSALVIAAILFFTMKQSWEALIVSGALIAWSIHWHESNNLWDYLLDPFLAVWAIVICIRWMIWGRPELVTYSAWDVDSSVLARRKRRGMFN